MARLELLLVFSLLLAAVNSNVLKMDKQEYENRFEQDDKREPDDEILEIANREYETEFGRILAVNMAHMKRRARATREKRDSVFKEIASINKGESIELYQGDIMVDAELKEMISGQKKRRKRNAQRQRKRLWNTRIIPYEVPYHMEHIRQNLDAAIKIYHDNTCLRFVPYNSYNHKNYILFTNEYGCSSKVGMKYYTSGYQLLSIGSGCNFVGTILHELMHAIGFFHEQSRGDRNSYLKVLWENILRGYSDQFDKYNWMTIDDLGKTYDYQSIMHYDRTAFTKNGLPTIVNIFDESMEFGTSAKTLSQKDIIEINALYDCHTTTYYGWSSWSDFTPCDEWCYKNRERYCYNAGNPESCPGSPNPYGIETQNISCSASDCPAINGHWGRWSEWSDCSVTCGDGHKTRTRKCNDPTPMRGGLYCPGSSTVSEGCVTKRCDLDLKYDDTDFEYNMGMWTNGYDDKLDWQRHQGYTQTMSTGPNRDHTMGEYGNGYYLYVESSSPALAYDDAKLRSPWLNPVSGGQCFKFFYFMDGSNMGELNVRIEQEGQTASEFPIFRAYGNQGFGWKKASVTIDTAVRYKLTFTAIIGGGYSDIAIDDVYIDPGKCDCQDTYYSGCPTWASQGECQTNENWMKANCQRSCSSCQVTTLPPTTTQAPTTPACKDLDPSCSSWAQSGYCDTNPDYMLSDCCHSCSCKDLDPSCPSWAQSGYCDTNPDYMLINCCHSCRSVCKDLDSSCPSWAQSGYCDTNPDYMLSNCCHSCSCKDLDPSCSFWAQDGHCETNPEYMQSNCCESCNGY